MTKWTDIKEFSAGHMRLLFLYRIYRLFGLKALQIIIIPIVLVAFIFMRNSRLASLQYFTRLYAVSGNTAHKPSLKNAFWHIHGFANALLDKMAAWNGGILHERLCYKTPEECQRFWDSLADGQGAFLLCSHLGNIEILRALSLDPEIGFTANAFMETAQTGAFNSFLKHINSQALINLYSTKDIGLNTACMIQDKIARGEIMVMAGDRVPAFNSVGMVPMDFLGAKAQFPVGAFRLAKALECNVYFLAICKNGKKFDVYLQRCEITDNRKGYLKMMQDYIDWLEDLTLLYPYQWFNFYDYWKKDHQ